MFLILFIFDFETGGDMLLENFGSISEDYMAKFVLLNILALLSLFIILERKGSKLGGISRAVLICSKSMI
jgi:hypothetical protein